ncbi:MAG TPA: hypothetical protein VNA87_07225, partial [Actinomycetota bacterium]|nr:hypothetical protein [Actinomycetota bacterium]
KLNGVTSLLSAGIEELGSKMSKSGDEMTGLPRDPQGQVNRDAAKRLIRQAASDMDSYSSRLEAELPIFSEHLRSGISALTRAASLSVDFLSDPSSRARAEESLQSVATLRSTIHETSGSLGGFRDTVAALPRMTSELNRSKRRLSQLLDQLVQEMISADQLLREAEAVFGDLVSGS